MDILKLHFKEWLIKKGLSEKTPSGRPSTVYEYTHRIEKICDRLYGRSYYRDWSRLAKDIYPVLAAHIIGSKKGNYLNQSETEAFLEPLKRQRCFNNIRYNHDEIESTENLDRYLGWLWKDSKDCCKNKKALFLFYEFLKDSEYKKDGLEYSEIDKKILKAQERCDNKITLIDKFPSINAPKQIIKESVDKTDYIDDEKASELLGINKSTLYRMAKRGEIVAYSSQCYSIQSINQYLSSNQTIVDATLTAGIDCDKEIMNMLKARDAAKKLDRNIRQLGRYREGKKLSFAKVSTGNYLYFPSDVERLSQELNKSNKK